MHLGKASGLLPLVALAAATGCGSAAIPVGQVTETQASIRAAQELGAERTPQAAMHLKMARDQVQTARAYMADGDNAEAWYLLKRAESDADLAIALTREAEMKRKAAQSRHRIEELGESAQ